jgi:predicted dehydrogenase
MSMIKLGIIGLGRMGGYHASVCAQLHQVELIGVADQNKENFKKLRTKNTEMSSDYKTWLDRVDGVIIAVPTQFHYQIAKDCLLAGKHVLLEKPLTKTLEEAEELFALATSKGLALHAGHVERFNGGVQELKKIIDAPFFIESHRMGPFAPRVQNDSVVLDLMIHDLDIILNLISSPVKSISAQGTKVYTDSCDLASVQICFENGTIAHLASSRASQIKKRTMQIHQKTEYINLDFTTQDIAIHRHASSSVQIGSDQLRYKQECSIEHLFVYKDNPLKQEIEYFINSITTGANLSNADQDLRALKVTYEIERLLGL